MLQFTFTVESVNLQNQETAERGRLSKTLYGYPILVK